MNTNNGKGVEGMKQWFSSLPGCLKKIMIHGFCAEDVQDVNQENEVNKNNNLRLLRSELQDMISLIGRAKAGKINFAQHVEYINKTKDDITDLMKEIQKIEDGNDSIRHILNFLEQMGRSDLFKPEFNKKKIEEQLELMTLAEEQAREIILYIGYETIPARVNDWLQTARAGYVVPFHFVFEDELQLEEDRNKVLNYISWKPTIIKHGLVDPNTGLIYRYHKTFIARFLWTVAIVAMFPLLIYLTGACVPDIIKLVNAKISVDPNVLSLYLLALLLGVYVHVLIDRAKVQQQTGLPNIIPLSDVGRYISSRRGLILYRTSLAVFVFFAFLVTVENPDKLSYSQFFLAGYGLDSVVDMFAAKLEKNVSTRFAAK